MADSKYADLPGIAYDQPDFYETEDLPEADQPDEPAEEDSDFIERPHLNVDTAFGKFKGKVLLKDRVDFSDKISRNLRTGYDARTCEWELVAQGEKETPMQKYQRLQCEMTELSEEINQLKGSMKEDASTGASIPVASQVQKLLEQLNEMRLEEQLGSELVTSLADPNGATLRKLLAQLETAQGAKPEDKKSSKGGTTAATAGEQGSVTYELLIKPEHAKLMQATRVSQLEQRLNALEKMVGDAPGKLSRLSMDTRHLPLAAAVDLLSTKASLLDSSQLDHIEGRLTALATKMNQVAERSAPPEEQEHEKKISELYELALKCDSMSNLLPDITERMTALQTLHEQALNFNKSLAQLDALQGQITTSLGTNDAFLKDVQKSFAQNMETMKKNITSLENRLSAIKKK